jgi:hypothetical protein
MCGKVQNPSRFSARKEDDKNSCLKLFMHACHMKRRKEEKNLLRDHDRLFITKLEIDYHLYKFKNSRSVGTRCR